jgi:hypothetical protein
MANPYQAPKAPVVDQPAGLPKPVMPLAAAVIVASAAAMALMSISTILGAAFAGAIILDGNSSLRVLLYFALEFALAFGAVYLCCVLAIRWSASNPYAAALPVGLICAAFSIWEGLGSLRTGDASFWYFLVLMLLPLAAAIAAALIRARGRKESPR